MILQSALGGLLGDLKKQVHKYIKTSVLFFGIGQAWQFYLPSVAWATLPYLPLWAKPLAER